MNESKELLSKTLPPFFFYYFGRCRPWFSAWTFTVYNIYIYIYVIADKLTSLTRLFADDTSFNCSHSDGTEIQSIINHDLKELDEWSKRWLMTFNLDKTEIMLFTNLEHPEINFTFEDNIISMIESHRHLGVTFSTDAKWNAHIENIVSSVSKRGPTYNPTVR